MVETFRNAWRVEELRKKILYTLMMLLIYRLGGIIPTPFVDTNVIKAAVENMSVLNMINFINGQNFSNFTIFAMGVQPYITSSIVMQLLTVAIPVLERWQKEGEEGRKRIAQITRYVTVALGALMAVGIILSFGPSAFVSKAPGALEYAVVFITLAAGTSFTMWIGERITENGIGNGISLLIFVGIIASFPGQIGNAIQAIQLNPSSAWFAPVAIVGIVLLVVGIVFVDEAQRRIPVQYAKRMVGRRMYGGQATHIPIKVNSAGVMPLIFAISIIQTPAIVASFMPQSAFAAWYGRWMSSGSWLYILLFALMIVFFTYFYATFTFNAPEISKNLQQNGGFVPGIRPGRPTGEYLQKISNRITFFGAIFLAVVATVPSIILVLTGSSSPFTATGILIVISVALETTKQLEAQMMMRHYKGFMKQ
ncbi:MAG: preprotein translocase subunit SecY [Christensenellaceae bacterium]|nr:preprotein translocase subunit SecY [Christensenellaceae bacterium]